MLRNFILVFFLALTRLAASDLSVSIITPNEVEISPKDRTKDGFVYQPIINALISGWQEEGLSIDIGSDENGAIFCLLPSRITLVSSDGKSIESINLQTGKAFSPAEIKAPDHLHLCLAIPSDQKFFIPSPGVYSLKLELIFKNSKGKEMRIKAKDVTVIFKNGA